MCLITSQTESPLAAEKTPSAERYSATSHPNTRATKCERVSVKDHKEQKKAMGWDPISQPSDT